ncbi:MAG TPA: hypothetical protein VHR17_14590, partial [Thermoanaerobaculia bacterium]|nr:hypothetical protein [Thermoanaerobaculia bacterium]
NGNDLFPGGLTGDGQTLTDAIVSIGFWNGAEPLDWSPAPVVQSATVELFDGNASVGGPQPVNVGAFFGAPGTWDGHFGIAYTNQAGKGIDQVVVRLVVPTPGGGGPATCVPTATTLCLAGDRFAINAQWQKRDGAAGAGQAVELTGDTGYFWFFGSSNVEVVVKVIDACGFVNRFWVFAGGLTDVSTTLRVTDTKTGEVRTYVNPLGTPFAPIQDTVAFATCP